MPLTFLSHQAPVLPLKIVAPRLFDGTALVIGSMAPDLAFATHGTGWYVDAHTLPPQLWLCLPLTLALTWIVKRVIAGPLAPHLPELGRFHLRDYGRLAAWRPPRNISGWLVLITSALIGSFSHLLLDSFTHGFGWVVQRVDALHGEAFELPASMTGRTVYVHDLLQLGGTVIGAAITIWCLRHIGRHRLIATWYPASPILEPTVASRRRLVVWTTAGLIAGLVVAAISFRVGGAQDLIMRVADLTFIGLVIGCCAAFPTMTGGRRSRHSMIPHGTVSTTFSPTASVATDKTVHGGPRDAERHSDLAGRGGQLRQ